jgi:hypothetical protein
MCSLLRIKSSNSLNKTDSKGNLLELNKSVSTNNLESNVTFLTEQKIFEESTWIPPLHNGLRNSEPIIPSYYLQTIEGVVDEKGIPIKYMNVDYLTIIKDDIRNFRKLNEYQILYIKKHLDDKIKNEIIDEFIKITELSIDIINGF